MLTLIPYLFSLASLLLAVYMVSRKETREDGQTTAQRLKKAEAALVNQEARQTGFQQEIEGVADHGKREREALADAHRRDYEELAGAHRRDYEALKEQIKDVPDMRTLLVRMDERFTSTKEEIKSTKEEIKSLKDDVKNVEKKADRIVELLTPPK